MVHEKQKTALFNLVCAYRLIDLTASVHGYSSEISVPRHVRDGELQTSCRPFQKHFHDWSQVIRNFKTCIAATSLPLLASVNHVQDVRVRLLKSFLKSNRLQGASNILSNFDFAALTLMYLGRNDFLPTTLPDTPGTATDMILFL